MAKFYTKSPQNGHKGHKILALFVLILAVCVVWYYGSISCDAALPPWCRCGNYSPGWVLITGDLFIGLQIRGWRTGTLLQWPLCVTDMRENSSWGNLCRFELQGERIHKVILSLSFLALVTFLQSAEVCGRWL